MAIKFGLGAAAQIARAVRAYEKAPIEGEGGQRPGVHRQPMLEGILEDDLDPATDVLTGTTTARVRLIRGDTLSDVLVRVVNRSVDLILESGTYVIVAWVNGSWRVIWADCSDSGISTSDESGSGGGGGGDDDGDGTYGGGGGYGG